MTRIIQMLGKAFLDMVLVFAGLAQTQPSDAGVTQSKRDKKAAKPKVKTEKTGKKTTRSEGSGYAAAPTRRVCSRVNLRLKPQEGGQY
jgi:hypothetical protein